MTTEIFLGYAAEDKATAQQLAASLRDMGMHCWLADERIAAGQSITAAIGNAIQNADAVVFLISNESPDNRWLITEAALAVAAGKKIIPLLLTPQAKPPFILADRSWLDLSKSGDIPFAAQKIAESMALPDDAEEALAYRRASIEVQSEQLRKEQQQWEALRMIKEGIMRQVMGLGFIAMAIVVALYTLYVLYLTHFDLTAPADSSVITGLWVAIGLIIGMGLTEIVHHLTNKSPKEITDRPAVSLGAASRKPIAMH